MRTGGFFGWLHRRRAVRVRRCTQCGATWTMPRRSGSRRHLTDGIPLTPELQSAGRLIGEQIVAGAQEDVEVREALAHCPQCGSGHFTESRASRRERTR